MPAGKERLTVEKIKIIIDTDIGDDIDDAYAVALALSCRELDVLGITTVYGNTAARVKIAKTLVKSYGANVKVYAGCGVPLISPYSLDINAYPCQYADYMDAEELEAVHGVDYIVEQARKFPEEITLIPIGALTNIALAIRKAPDIVSKIKRVVLMGGCVKTPESLLSDANFTGAEFNILCDPEAARIVYTSGVKITQVGLEVTRKCVMTKKEVEEFKAFGNHSCALLYELTQKWLEAYLCAGPMLHDPLAVSVLTHDFCSFRDVNIHIALDGADRGRTLEVSPETPFSNIISVAENVNAAAFLDFFKRKLLK